MCRYIKILFFLLLILRGGGILAATIEIQKVHPLNWYVGMKNPNLQILVYGKNLADYQVALKPYKGVLLKKVHKVENPNYLFIDLTIAKTTQAGTLELTLSNARDKTNIRYELKQRLAQPKGLNPSDLIYLIMPDRFSNGDPSNDKFSNMTDTTCDRQAHSLRHGGDLKGISQHLDYIKDLGATALWLTPVIENDQPIYTYNNQPYSCYHGYAFTDHYQVDARFGGNDAYSKFVEDAHKKGLKIVQDAVYNHSSSAHWFFKDLPMKDWVHQWKEYTGSNYRNPTIQDPYASARDKKLMVDGWFVPTMPDLNQNNPFLATYLIQNAIWITEYFKIDAWRIDTYIYCDLEFMNRCNQALMDEFPNIFMFGESWVHTVANQAYFVKNNLNIPFKSNQLSGCDFQLHTAFKDALTQPYSWTDVSVNRLYNVLAQDFLYKKPEHLVTFLDNHDTDRFLSSVGDDVSKLKMGIIWLLTLRGIPQVYYGTEVLMKNTKAKSDGDVREDFKGGWKEDKISRFTVEGRTEQENEFFNFFKKLAQYRQKSPALTQGKLMQFAPHEGLYVYARYTDKQRVIVLSNVLEKEQTISTQNYDEILRGAKGAKNIITDESLSDISSIKIPAKSCIIIEIL